MGDLADELRAAMLFHDTYERLAPSFGYETRPDTKAFDPESPNGRLMIAVCGEVLAALATPDQSAINDARGRTIEECVRHIEEVRTINADQSSTIKLLREALEKAAPFVGWASTRGQVLAGVHADDKLCDEIDAALRAQPSRDDVIEAQSIMHDQGYAAGLEAAAKIIETRFGRFAWSQDQAAAIRALKESQ